MNLLNAWLRVSSGSTSEGTHVRLLRLFTFYHNLHSNFTSHLYATALLHIYWHAYTKYTEDKYAPIFLVCLRSGYCWNNVSKVLSPQPRVFRRSTVITSCWYQHSTRAIQLRTSHPCRTSHD